MGLSEGATEALDILIVVQDLVHEVFATGTEMSRSFRLRAPAVDMLILARRRVFIGLSLSTANYLSD